MIKYTVGCESLRPLLKVFCFFYPLQFIISAEQKNVQTFQNISVFDMASFCFIDSSHSRLNLIINLENVLKSMRFKCLIVVHTLIVVFISRW